MTIAFFPQPNIILQIGSVSLYVYGAMYAIGTIACMYWLFLRMKRYGISFDTIADIGVVTLAAGVVGGRLFYALLYNTSYMLEHPLEILKVWHGGMSIHGGLLAGALAFVLMCRKKNIDWKVMADALAPALAFALMLGRFGNFVNGELVGRPTTMPWGMDFGDGVNRHPAQLYAMAKDALLSIGFASVLMYFQDKPFWKPGQLFFLFIISYGVLRFIVEFFRAPDPQLGLLYFLSMGQWLSLAVIGIGVFCYKKLGSKQ